MFVPVSPAAPWPAPHPTWPSSPWGWRAAGVGAAGNMAAAWGVARAWPSRATLLGPDLWAPFDLCIVDPTFAGHLGVSKWQCFYL